LEGRGDAYGSRWRHETRQSFGAAGKGGAEEIARVPPRAFGLLGDIQPAEQADAREISRSLEIQPGLPHVILWLMPTFGLALNRLDVPIMPLFVLLAAALAWARLQAAAKVELPEAAGAR